MRPAREEPGFSVEAGAHATPAPLSRAPAGWQADPGKMNDCGRVRAARRPDRPSANLNTGCPVFAGFRLGLFSV